MPLVATFDFSTCLPMPFIEQIQHITNYVQQSFTALDEEQLNWKTDASKWSIAQCLDHLIVTNTAYFKGFDKILSPSFKQTLWQQINPLNRFGANKMLQYTTAVNSEPFS